jgi:DNA-binding LytR/AlgR family response regulator
MLAGMTDDDDDLARSDWEGPASCRSPGEAGSTEEAIQALRLEMKFDLAFLDIEGDEGAGFQLAQTMRKHRPTVRVVLAAGVPRAAAEAGELCEQGPTQRKPDDHRTLEKHIRRLLAQ